MLGVMLWLDWDFALLAVAVTPFLLLFVARFNREVKRATHEVRRYQSDIVAVTEQGLESMRVIQAFGRQDLEERRLSQVSQASVDAALKARRAKSLLSPAVALTVALCTALVLWRGSALVLAGAMSIGSLTVFLTYLSKFFKPVQDLAKMSSTIAQTSVAIERIQTILDADEVLPQRPDGRDPGTLRGRIELDRVSFAYDPKTPVLKGVTLTIAPGESVGIVGPTGGGKSTVVSLIPRFYDPTSGVVCIDGVDLREYRLDALRRNIGYVLQDTALFHGTIRDNIAYGRIEATDAEILAAGKLANVDEFVARLPDGYATMVGERGATLSGGQRQRIGIARAVLRDAPILILDEPTAALDTESEKLVIEALRQLMKGRTVLTVAHRLSTIRHADRILVLKDGVVAEQGTHDELVALGGTYAQLYRTQAEGAPAAATA
jgi:subfamily B ATP-binding cassette protein MsbA